MTFPEKGKTRLSSRAFLKLTLSLALMALFIVTSANSCLAESSGTPPRQPDVDTGHIVGDTLARGIEFGLKPIHLGLSKTFFWIARTPEPKHITTIKHQGPSSR